MRLLLTLLFALLLASLGLPGASADDVRVDLWERLMQRGPEAERPVLGLLTHGVLPTTWTTLDVHPDERPGTEEESDDDDDVREYAAWLLSWGHGGDVAAGLLRRIAVDAEVRTPSGAVHRGRLVAAPGRRALLARTHSLRVVTDYDAELACDNSGGLRPCAVGDPQVDTLVDGLALDVRSFPVGGDRVALQVLLQAGRFERPVARLHTRALFLGDLAVPRYRGVLLSASGAAAVGESFDIAVEGSAGGRYDLRLTPRILDVPESEDRARVQHLDASLLVTPWVAVGFDRNPDIYWNPPAHVVPGVEWRIPAADRGVLWEHIDQVLPETEFRLLPDGNVWLVADEDAAQRVGRSFDAWTASLARTVRVEITARAEGEVIGRVEVPVLTGRTGFFRLGVDQAVLKDADVEVG